MRLIRQSVLVVAAGLVALLTSCASAPPEGAWVIAPIEYDNAPDGSVSGDMIDVTYPMPHIASDSAGGFWTESGGSWLHIDRDGTATRRFNLEGEMEFLRVRGISAVDSSTLIVSGHVDGEWGGGLWQFDTTAMAWTPIPTEATVVGDVAAVGDIIVYVEYFYDTGGNVSFVVRRLDHDNVDAIVTPQSDVRDGDVVKLSVMPNLSIIANTGSQLLVIDPSGEVTVLSEFASATPVSSVSGDGVTAWATDPRVSDEPWYVDGGSSEARRVIETNGLCDPRSIETSEQNVSPPLCNIQALEWIDANTIVVSAGTEGGSVLAKLRAP